MNESDLRELIAEEIAWDAFEAAQEFRMERQREDGIEGVQWLPYVANHADMGELLF